MKRKESFKREKTAHEKILLSWIEGWNHIHLRDRRLSHSRVLQPKIHHIQPALPHELHGFNGTVDDGEGVGSTGAGVANGEVAAGVQR